MILLSIIPVILFECCKQKYFCSLIIFYPKGGHEKHFFHIAWHYQSQLPEMGKIKTLMGVRGIMPSGQAKVWSCDEFSQGFGVEWGSCDLKFGA